MNEISPTTMQMMDIKKFFSKLNYVLFKKYHHESFLKTRKELVLYDPIMKCIYNENYTVKNTFANLPLEIHEVFRLLEIDEQNTSIYWKSRIELKNIVDELWKKTRRIIGDIYSFDKNDIDFIRNYETLLNSLSTVEFVIISHLLYGELSSLEKITNEEGKYILQKHEHFNKYDNELQLEIIDRNFPKA